MLCEINCVQLTNYSFEYIKYLALWNAFSLVNILSRRENKSTLFYTQNEIKIMEKLYEIMTKLCFCISFFFILMKKIRRPDSVEILNFMCPCVTFLVFITIIEKIYNTFGLTLCKQIWSIQTIRFVCFRNRKRRCGKLVQPNQLLFQYHHRLQHLRKIAGLLHCHRFPFHPHQPQHFRLVNIILSQREMKFILMTKESRVLVDVEKYVSYLNEFYPMVMTEN